MQQNETAQRAGCRNFTPSSNSPPKLGEPVGRKVSLGTICGTGFVDVTRLECPDRQGHIPCNDFSGFPHSPQKAGVDRVVNVKQSFAKDSYIDFQTTRRRESSFTLAKRGCRSLSFHSVKAKSSTFEKQSSWLGSSSQIHSSPSKISMSSSFSSIETVQGKNPRHSRNKKIHRISKVVRRKRMNLCKVKAHIPSTKASASQKWKHEGGHLHQSKLQ